MPINAAPRLGSTSTLKQQSLFATRRIQNSIPNSKLVKRIGKAYALENRQCAEIFLLDPERYAGIQLEWAQLWMERNR